VFWCGDKQQCSPSGTECLLSHNCPNYCGTFSNCGDCSQAMGCGWCDDTGVCADVSESTCFFAHTCTSTKHESKKCGFNGGAFVGGMFFVIGLVVLGVGGYLFYRWRSGRKFDYRELK